MTMNRRNMKKLQMAKRLEQVTKLALEEGYETVTVYKKKKSFIAYEANDMFHRRESIYIVVEYDDNIPYLALKSVVDEM